MRKKYLVVGIMLMLFVVGLSGCTQQTNEEQQTGENQSPTVTISADPLTGYQPLEVSFDITADDQDGSVESFVIEFGDGTSSFEMNPTHTYSSVGTYTVVVTATDDKEAETSEDVIITVKNHAPSASASANIVSGTAPLEVNFTGFGNDSDGTIVTYYWDFDDGSSSDMQNPNHTFETVGIYTVTLTVTDNDEGMGTDIISINVVESSFSLNPIADTYVDPLDLPNDKSLLCMAELLPLFVVVYDLTRIPQQTSNVCVLFTHHSPPFIADSRASRVL